MKILSKKQIQQKVARLAIQILEHNYQEKELVFVGINDNGSFFAKMLQKELQTISKINIHLTKININPAQPLEEAVSIDMSLKDLMDKVLIVIDDVSNTGRTIFYAFKPLLEVLPKKVEVAVLVDRTHKSFPVEVNYFGLSLATTLLENIDVRIQEEAEEFGVYLT